MPVRDYGREERRKEGASAQRPQICCGDSMSLVHITSFEERVPCGELLNLSYNEKFTFRGLDQMLLIMEDIMDVIKVPGTFLSHRYLSEKPYVFETVNSENRINTLERPGVHGLRHIPADFYIRCEFRQHGSMQGELIVVQRKRSRKIHFRSDLELMRMIYQQLDQEDTTDRIYQ